MNVEIGKIIIVMGIALIGVGIFFLFFSSGNGIPRLPGDIFVKKDNGFFYFPIVSSIVISIILTILFNLFSRK